MKSKKLGHKRGKKRDLGSDPRGARPRRTLRVGLTGSVASGKSTVLNFFKKLGWKTISSDTLVSKVYADLGMTKEKLRVGLSHSRLKKLERLVHPLVQKEIFAEFKKTKSKPILVEVPLLFEAKFDEFFDFNLFVFCPRELRKSRAIKRGMAPGFFDFLDAKQWSSEKKAKRADFILHNSQSQKTLHDQTKLLSRVLASSEFPK